MTEKPLAWLGSSLADIRTFPAGAKRAAGYQLGRVQQGLMPDDWKPMTTVGAGVYEIRIHTRSGFTRGSNAASSTLRSMKKLGM